jgi:hypothetical protein
MEMMLLRYILALSMDYGALYPRRQCSCKYTLINTCICNSSGRKLSLIIIGSKSAIIFTVHRTSAAEYTNIT